MVSELRRLYRKPLGIKKILSQGPLFCAPFLSSYAVRALGRDCFGKFAPHNLFSGYLREQHFRKTQKGKKGCGGPIGKFYLVSESPVTGSVRGFPDSLQTESGNLGDIGLLAFSVVLRDLLKFSCTLFYLSVCHLVLSLVSYFFFPFIIIF